MAEALVEAVARAFDRVRVEHAGYVESDVYARAALAAIEAAGYALVPKEPTEAMLSCMVDGHAGPWAPGSHAEFYGTYENMAENYRAMLSAASK